MWHKFTKAPNTHLVDSSEEESFPFFFTSGKRSSAVRLFHTAGPLTRKLKNKFLWRDSFGCYVLIFTGHFFIIVKWFHYLIIGFLGITHVYDVENRFINK